VGQKRELYGRVLVVFAAQHYASQLVLPNSKRHGSVLPRSHKDTARKAFEKVTKKVLPASYVQLQRALAAEARTYSSSVDALNKPASKRAATADVDAQDEDAQERDDELVEDPEPDEDLERDERD
jgi:hypothetical protein